MSATSVHLRLTVLPLLEWLSLCLSPVIIFAGAAGTEFIAARSGLKTRTSAISVEFAAVPLVACWR